MKKAITRFLAVVFLLMVAIVGYFFSDYFGIFATKKNIMSDRDYYHVSGERVGLFYNFNQQSTAAIYRDGVVYLPFSWVQSTLSNFYWSDDQKVMLVAQPTSMARIGLKDKDKTGKPAFIIENETKYLSLNIITQYADVRIDDFSGDEIRHINIFDNWGDYQTATIERETKMYTKEAVTADQVRKLEPGEKVRLLDYYSDDEYASKKLKWVKVVTDDNHTGYVKKSFLSTLEVASDLSTNDMPKYTSIHLDKPIVLGWHQVTVQAANGGFDEAIKDTKGLNVISPTWFALSDNDGNYKSYESEEYVQKAHAQGIQVWALVDNFNTNVNSEILLAKSAARDKIISGMIKSAKKYKFDGINVDFEQIRQNAKPHYIEFIRELSIACRKNNLVLSVDVPNYADYNAFYSRKDLAKIVDYVINMGYDEHTNGTSMGSVSSIGYVKKGLERTLKEVPAEKLINGVPFYTRIWTKKNGETTSKAIGISDAKAWITQNNVDLTWDDKLGQYYGEIKTDDTKQAIWMEEEKSLGLKVDLIKEKNLAGVGCWKLGFEPSSVWDVIDRVSQ